MWNNSEYSLQQNSQRLYQKSIVYTLRQTNAPLDASFTVWRLAWQHLNEYKGQVMRQDAPRCVCTPEGRYFTVPRGLRCCEAGRLGQQTLVTLPSKQSIKHNECTTRGAMGPTKVYSVYKIVRYSEQVILRPSTTTSSHHLSPLHTLYLPGNILNSFN